MKHLLLFLLLLAGLIALLNHQFPDALGRSDNGYHLTYLIILAIIIGGSVIASNRTHWKRNLQYATGWAGIFLVLMIGYTYKEQLLDSKLGSELIPGRTTIEANGSMTLHARADGHFYINATINNHKLRFMIDTGASDIMLTRETADRVGLTIAPDAKKQRYSTASGITHGLEVTIGQLRVGDFVLKRATAYVNQGNATTNLLGMDFLNALSSYTVEGGTMTLVP